MPINPLISVIDHQLMSGNFWAFHWYLLISNVNWLIHCRRLILISHLWIRNILARFGGFTNLEHRCSQIFCNEGVNKTVMPRISSKISCCVDNLLKVQYQNFGAVLSCAALQDAHSSLLDQFTCLFLSYYLTVKSNGRKSKVMAIDINWWCWVGFVTIDWSKQLMWIDLDLHQFISI